MSQWTVILDYSTPMELHFDRLGARTPSWHSTVSARSYCSHVTSCRTQPTHNSRHPAPSTLPPLAPCLVLPTHTCTSSHKCSYYDSEVSNLVVTSSQRKRVHRRVPGPRYAQSVLLLCRLVADQMRTRNPWNKARMDAGAHLIAGELDHIKISLIFLGSTNAIEGSPVPKCNRGTPFCPIVPKNRRISSNFLAQWSLKDPSETMICF